MRQALHIEGDQTATDAARGLEDVATRVIDRHSVGEPDAGDGWVQCTACAAWCDWERDLEPEAAAIARVEHEGNCLLELAWRALGKPGAVGSSPPGDRVGGSARPSLRARPPSSPARCATPALHRGKAAMPRAGGARLVHLPMSDSW